MVTSITVLHDRKEVKIRLHGIDTPEKKQPFGQAAKKAAAQLTAGKIVEIDLSNLFESELIIGCEHEEAYFDQRFIEYFNKQKCDLEDIHWRQFEYLTGEFFHRSGYTVIVNKGKGDGGIDVVAVKENDITGPEKIFVQCKKYMKSNHIQLDSVRAFWATVSDEHATKGIIATTSCLTKGSQDYCKARLYRLAAAEADKIEKWKDKMKKC